MNDRKTLQKKNRGRFTVTNGRFSVSRWFEPKASRLFMKLAASRAS